VVAIDLGFHGLALKADGTVVGWGHNAYGQATPPAGLTGVAAIGARAHDSLALKADGTVVAWGYGVYGQTNVPAGLTGVVAIAAGGYHNLALVAGAPTYEFVGFFQPVDNLVWNRAKAGQAIPVKFSLAGDQGLDLFTPGFPKAVQAACPGAGTPIDPIETYAIAAGGSALSYDALSDEYSYVWKTERSWGGKCFRFELGLHDGSNHTFETQFTK
jgi:hypothetical protein